MDHKATGKKYNRVLSEAFNFTSYDLEINEQGAITQNQLPRLYTRLMGSVLQIALYVGWLLVMLFALPLIVDTYATNIPESQLQTLILIALIGIPAIIYVLTHRVGNLFDRCKRALRDLSMRHAAAVTGKVILSVHGSEFVEYRLKLDDFTAKLNQQQFLAIKNGDPYTIFYAEQSEIILSAMWLRDDPFEDT